MPSKRKPRGALKKPTAITPSELRFLVLRCIRSYGQPMPVSKLSQILSERYGPLPTIKQVFRCDALVFLEEDMRDTLRVSFNESDRQYYVSPINKTGLPQVPKPPAPTQASKTTKRFTTNKFRPPKWRQKTELDDDFSKEFADLKIVCSESEDDRDVTLGSVSYTHVPPKRRHLKAICTKTGKQSL